MRSLPIITETYQHHLTNFVHWLQTLGYSVSTCYNLPNHLHEFFYYLESNELVELEQVKSSTIQDYFTELQRRGNQRTGKPLSVAHLKKHLQALKRFSVYLQSLNQTSLNLPDIHFTTDKAQVKKINILSSSEIERLYETCGGDVLGLRDRAMLSLYYGCGLRRTEGTRLNVWDVQLKKKLLFIAPSKNGCERYVPLAPRVADDLYNYLYQSRPHFKNADATAAFLLSMQGYRLGGQTLQLRLKYLVQKAVLSTDQIGLHTLRHSIATHLLEGGLSLKNIALFLGHKSLESTQIYTHVAK